MEPAQRPIRIGFLVPPGNPTVEVEMIALAPPEVSVHFTRMVAHGAAGSHHGQEERNRSQVAHLPQTVALGVKCVALGTPYDADATAKGKASLEAHGIEVVSVGRLENVKNIYEETAERAHGLARRIDVPQAQAVFLSGLGMPTLATLERMERDLGKPAVSAAAAMMWNALRVAGVAAPIPGFGRLLAGRR